MLHKDLFKWSNTAVELWSENLSPCSDHKSLSAQALNYNNFCDRRIISVMQILLHVKRSPGAKRNHRDFAVRLTLNYDIRRYQ